MIARAFVISFIAFFTVAAPAHAVVVESLDLNFGNGYQEIGDLGINESPYIAELQQYAPLGPMPTLYLNGSPVTPSGVGLPNTTPDEFVELYGSPPTLFILGFAGEKIPNLNFSDYTLNGVVATSGTSTCISGCDLAAVPLPASLPLFGFALVSLGAFALRRKVHSLS